MSGELGFDNIRSCLDAAGTGYRTLSVGDNAQLLAMEYGGHVLGPFVDGGDSLPWLNANAFRTSDTLRAFVQDRNWNVGGDRVWVSPEIRFHVKDRARFWETLALPETIDPGLGDVRIVSNGNEQKPVLSVEREIATITDHQTGNEVRDLTIRMDFEQCADPLRTLDEPGLRGSVTFAGYRNNIRFELSEPGEVECEPWVLLQVWPGGQALIPVIGDATFSDYFEESAQPESDLQNQVLSFGVSGQRRYKAGIKSLHSVGRFGYLRKVNDEMSSLVVRSFMNNPSYEYLEEPPAVPQDRGYSIHVVDDGGSFGGFGEVEWSGCSLGGRMGTRVSVNDSFTWWYYGDHDSIQTAAHLLVGKS
ncbi:MAG: hypothetical protein EA383_06740 [Spirochaetaceae bacterium]|nr:MAG: hypothetical protein EA383_06740 [Spirochaetaceae bacterium]